MYSNRFGQKLLLNVSNEQEKMQEIIEARGLKLFTAEQCKWIVIEFWINPFPVSLKRTFVINYGIEGREKTRYQPNIFDSC